MYPLTQVPQQTPEFRAVPPPGRARAACPVRRSVEIFDATAINPALSDDVQSAFFLVSPRLRAPHTPVNEGVG